MPVADLFPDYGYLTGRCRPCRRVFRWPSPALKLRDAVCLSCDGPLSKFQGQARVEEVEADWMRRPPTDPQNPATWP